MSIFTHGFNRICDNGLSAKGPCELPVSYMHLFYHGSVPALNVC